MYPSPSKVIGDGATTPATAPAPLHLVCTREAPSLNNRPSKQAVYNHPGPFLDILFGSKVYFREIPIDITYCYYKMISIVRSVFPAVFYKSERF